jgi:hypothetical protein
MNRPAQKKCLDVALYTPILRLPVPMRHVGPADSRDGRGQDLKKIQPVTRQQKRQVNAVLPVALHQAVRMIAAERGVRVSNVIEEALTRYLGSRAPRGAVA